MENRKNKNNKMSREIWKVVEVKTGKTRVVEAERIKVKRKRNKEVRR